MNESTRCDSCSPETGYTVQCYLPLGHEGIHWDREGGGFHWSDEPPPKVDLKATMTRLSFLRIAGVGSIFLSALGGILVGRKLPIGTFSPLRGIGTADHPLMEKLAHGPLDPINSNQLWCRQQVASALQRAFPTCTTCMRCGFPWAIAKGKSVESAKWRGLFAICHDCWDELQVAQYRAPYYRALCEENHADWLRYKDKYPDDPDPLTYWPTILANIEKESGPARGTVWIRTE